ncbi:hypothetical protein VE03_03693 [Pseudogymnoascus sp. 23342-1-I1]|nr:hypothetical protein VE03_03693 [Pseudogymnoascus sp. 23342-1-I1]
MEKNTPPDSGNNADQVPLSNDDDAKNKPPNPTTSKDHGHRKSETKKADEESGDGFDHVSEPREQYCLIMDQMLNMDGETFKKKYPPPKHTRPSIGPEEAFKLIKQLTEDTDDEDETEEVAPKESQVTKK